MRGKSHVHQRKAVTWLQLWCMLSINKEKVRVTLVQALRLCTGRTAYRGSRGLAFPFHDHSTRRGWGVSVMSGPLLTPWKTWYPLYRRPGGPQGRSGQVRKVSPPPGYDPRTVQPVNSRYTDYATRSVMLWVQIILLSSFSEIGISHTVGLRAFWCRFWTLWVDLCPFFQQKRKKKKKLCVVHGLLLLKE